MTFLLMHFKLTGPLHYKKCSNPYTPISLSLSHTRVHTHKLYLSLFIIKKLFSITMYILSITLSPSLSQTNSLTILYISYLCIIP